VRLLILRHLPTEWNRAGLLQGRQDLPLLPPADGEAAMIGENLARIRQAGPPTLVLTSELRRTHQSAERYGFSRIHTEPLLNELDFGRYEGRERALLLAEQDPAWSEDPRALVLGEAIADLAQRVRDFLAAYRDHPCLLCFGHGAWIRCLLSLLEHGDARAMNRVHVDNNMLHELNIPSVETDTP